MDSITYITPDTSTSLATGVLPYAAFSLPVKVTTANTTAQGRVIIPKISGIPTVARAKNVQDEFTFHRKKWQRDTQYLSSPVDRYLHPSYSRIIALVAANGSTGLQIILRDLQKNQNDWFYALRSVTGENPVKASMAGAVPKMARAWVEWGVKRGLINGGAT